MYQTDNLFAQTKDSDFQKSVTSTLKGYGFSDRIMSTIEKEKLLPLGLLKRLHRNYPLYSGIVKHKEVIFVSKERYSGLTGFREIAGILKNKGIDIGYIEERELFIKI